MGPCKRTREGNIIPSCSNYNLDLTSTPKIDESGIQTRMETIYSTYNLDSDVVEFVINPSNDYTDLHGSLLHVAGQILSTKPVTSQTQDTQPSSSSTSGRGRGGT